MFIDSCRRAYAHLTPAGVKPVLGDSARGDYAKKNTRQRRRVFQHYSSLFTHFYFLRAWFSFGRINVSSDW